MPAPVLVEGALFARDFEIVRPLGEGGMGAVYVALQRSTGKLRALKLMHPSLVADPSLRRRFEQEARIASLVESEHVVEVVAAGVDEASRAPWLAMELLHGEDLASFLEANGPLPDSAVRTAVTQLCHGVGAAHAAGIIHRDLKPENIFLAESRRAGERRVVKILDFGLAKLTLEAATKHTGAMGSPMWMAPEQTERAVLTPAVDVWAIGLVVFAMLTGKSFWVSANEDDSSIQQVLREVLFEPIPLASARAAEYGATLPAGFDAWFARCVVRDPAARFQDATELYAAFDSVDAWSVPIGAGSAPPVAKRAPEPRRRSALVPLAAALGIGVVAIAAYAADARRVAREKAAIDANAHRAAIAATSPSHAAGAAPSELHGGPARPAPSAERSTTALRASHAARNVAIAASASGASPSASASASPSASVSASPSASASAPEPLPTRLDGAAVQRVVVEHGPIVKRTCWQNVSDSTPPQVNVTLTAVIAPSGVVTSATSTGDDPDVSACVAHQVRSWTFPPAEDETTVNIPFHFVRQ